jgi:hypothetical protein
LVPVAVVFARRVSLRGFLDATPPAEAWDNCTVVVVAPPVREEIGENVVDGSSIVAGPTRFIFFAKMVSMFLVKTVIGMLG